MKRLISIVLICLFLNSCASMSNTEKGAVAGAVGGGILGGLFGDTKGAVIGAFAGAIIGAVIGNYYDRQVASRDEAAKKYEYKAEKEDINVEDTSVTPQNIKPGSAVDTSVQYTVLAPSENQQINVTETRTLINGKEKMELAKRDVVRPQGTHVSTMRFTVPNDIEKTDYTLVTTVSTPKQKKTAKNRFKVI